MTENNYKTATGKIDYNMTNDYMFRVILQENQIVLRSLICSLLHLQEHEIQTVEVTNPIILGANITEKEFILDINVNLNNNSILNLEMQMQDEGNWTDRALNYTCRNFTHIQKGLDYDTAQSAIHIGFLNYTLFPEYPEFYSTYMLKNIKTHHLFSSKIRIGVVNLNQIELATDEDIKYGLDKWVALFKSKTWEELRMIANEKPELLAATKSLYKYNNEDTIRFQCYAREDYRRKMNTIERDRKRLAELEAEHYDLVSQNIQLATQNDALASQNDTLASQNDALASQNAELLAKIEQLEKNCNI